MSRPDRAFSLVWAAQAVSAFGSEISGLALPLFAVQALGAGPVEMGWLGAAGTLPFLLFALPAGAWVDRGRRRPVLVAADLARAALIASVPLAAAWGVASFAWLWAVTFLAGVGTVFFDVADQSFLPRVVPRDRLVVANARLQATASLAGIAGPGLAGVLVQALSAPLAVLLDALSFLASAALLGTLRVPEPPGEARAGRGSLWPEVREGLAVVAGHRALRAIVAATATSNLFSGAFGAVFVLFATRSLGLTPAALGFVFAAGSVGGLLGALLAGRVAARLGTGVALRASLGVGGLAAFLVPLAGGPVPLVLVLLAAQGVLRAMGSVVY
ncbi:MAG TPA: MFS transporter, partial [Deinococcales bacterium]|nr:MFS transporter [Deinococcales bacterium]